MKNNNKSVNQIMSDKNLMKQFAFAADRDAFLHEHDCIYGEHEFLLRMLALDGGEVSDESLDYVYGGVNMSEQQIVGMLENIGSQNGYDESTIKQLVSIAMGMNGVM